MNILGISAYYHDGAAALVRSGSIVAAAQEERFTRKKHDAGFPAKAIGYCLDEAGLVLTDVDHILLGLANPPTPWIVAAVLSIWGLAAPSTLRPVYMGWMRFGLVMNRITTPLVLGVIFYIVITPVGIIMKLFGRDSMLRKLDPEASTYGMTSRKAPPYKMERPF